MEATIVSSREWDQIPPEARFTELSHKSIMFQFDKFRWSKSVDNSFAVGTSKTA